MRQPPPLFEEDYALSLRICQSRTSLAPSFVITDGVDCTHRGSRQSFTLGAFAPPADLIASINELQEAWCPSLHCAATRLSMSPSNFRHAASISSDQSAPMTSRSACATMPKKATNNSRGVPAHD